MRDGRVAFTACNNAGARLLGRSREALEGRQVDELVHAPDMLEAVRRLDEHGTASWAGSVRLVERPRVRIDSTLSLLDTDEDGHRFSLHMVDVTEPVELRERLEQERGYTRAVIDTASSLIVVTSIDGTVIAANPATTARTGFTEDELVGRPLWEKLVPAERRAAVAERFGDPEQLRRVGETVLNTRSGQRLTIEFSNHVHQLTPDAPVTYVLSGTDVTAAREHAGMVDHLLRSATTTGFVGTDLDGVITLFNTGAERMLGLPAQPRPDARSRSSSPPKGATPRGVFQDLVDQAAELGPETRDGAGCRWDVRRCRCR